MPKESIRQAADRTIAALEAAGRLEEVDAARVAALRLLADQLDEHPTYSKLWTEYRAVEESVRGNDKGDDDGFEELMLRLQTPVRHPKKP